MTMFPLAREWPWQAAIIGVQRLMADADTYLSRVETGNMTCGEYPSEALIHRLADALDADEDELLLMTKKLSPPPPLDPRRIKGERSQS